MGEHVFFSTNDTENLLFSSQHVIGRVEWGGRTRLFSTNDTKNLFFFLPPPPPPPPDSITRAQHRLEGRNPDELAVEARAKSIFEQCDLNDDGKISQEEFLKAGGSVAEMFELEGDGDE